MNYALRINTMNALLAICNHTTLRWERGLVYARWGRELLKRDAVEEAAEKFRASVADLAAAFEERVAVATDWRESVIREERRLFLAQHYLELAEIEKLLYRFEEARAVAEAAIETLKNAGDFFSSIVQDLQNLLLGDARALLGELSRLQVIRTKRKNAGEFL